MKKKDLRIVFLGTPEFAVCSLDKICKDGFNVVAVVTMPDKPAGRGHKMFQSPVKEYAVQHGLPVLQPVNLKDEAFVEELRSYNADIFVVIAFRMLPKVVWTMPPLGTFNLHASLLPDYRGAAPINWAVINGEKRTGVTTFFLKHEIDTGDIISQQAIDIADDENVGSVHDRLMTLGADLTLETLNSIIAGTLKTIPQDDLLKGAEPKPAPKIFKETCKLDFTKPVIEIYNKIRGLSPYPASYVDICDDATPEPRQLKIFKAVIVDKSANNNPGEISIANDRLFIDAPDGTLEILELQIQGKKKMSASDFIHGAKLVNPKLT
ncbi:MAG: methionyl-tRNA formyltransferase [Muribaculaceae bacterium]